MCSAPEPPSGRVEVQGLWVQTELSSPSVSGRRGAPDAFRLVLDTHGDSSVSRGDRPGCRPRVMEAWRNFQGPWLVGYL